MSKLSKIFELGNIQEQIKKFEQLYKRSNSKAGIHLDHEDILYVIDRLDSIKDPELWNAIWSVLIMLPKNNELVEYCNKSLQPNRKIGELSVLPKNLSLLLKYLFKNMQENREQLFKEFLNSTDIQLQFAAVEELANTDLSRALILMLDVYECAIHTYNHDIVDAIDIWIYYEGNTEVLNELEKRIDRMDDENLKSTFVRWRQHIQSKVAAHP